MTDITSLKDKVLSGTLLTPGEAMSLADTTLYDEEALWEASTEITERFSDRKFDSCSIINARSGKCGEDCKWCAQSARHDAHVSCYPLVDEHKCIGLARYNRDQGIGRFSMVTSGRALAGDTLARICTYYRKLRQEGHTYLCASMGLLGPGELTSLREAGVGRYHCNLETAPSYFSTLCTTHTTEDKIQTLLAAREAGMEVCSGGIIGMGETMAQRVELALELRRVNPVSIPINVLHPIPGTPLADMPPLTDSEILTTVAIFRMIHPRVVLRFAGGRDRISPAAQRKALRIGINGAIMGDLLTTVGSQIADDKAMVRECGYEF